ncbi:MAG: hypothetical protein UT10_C0026G0022, partial [Candidatus Woesebacteria bacterium GW2011_GWB1_38_8b]
MNFLPNKLMHNYFKIFYSLALFLIIFIFNGTKNVYSQTAPTFGCAMRQAIRVCTAGVCVNAPAGCYPTDLGSACPDNPSQGLCYAVENQETCQAHPDNPNTDFDECEGAGRYSCVQVPCETRANPPTFSCDWYPVEGVPRCIADINPSLCPNYVGNDICYIRDNQQCLYQNQR